MDSKSSEFAAAVNEKTKAFMAYRKILILDSSGSTRTQLVKLVMELGALRSNVFTSKNFEEAEKILSEEKVQVLLSEYELSGKSCLPLMQKVVDEHAEQDRLVILIAQNGNQSSVAQALEGQVDSYIIKPFAYNYLKESFEKNVLKKLHPTKYQKSLIEAREHIEKRSFYLAEPILLDLIKSQPKPSMALYYFGVLYRERGDSKKARQFWEKALAIQDSHYKSLSALYELAWREEDWESALFFLGKLQEILPLSPTRLGQLLQLYDKAGRYVELIQAMPIYHEIDEKPESLVEDVKRLMQSAGEYFLAKKKLGYAQEAFAKYLSMQMYEFTAVDYVVKRLLQDRQYQLAEFFLAKTRVEERASLAFMALEFQLNARLQGQNYIVQRGRELLKIGVKDPEVHRLYIESNFKQSRATVAEQALMDAKNQMPEFSDLWQQLEEKLFPVDGLAMARKLAS